MPVVVTGADTPLGAAVVAALTAAGAPVRATVRDRAAVRALVAAGTPTAVSDLVDPLRLGAVLDGAHTVIHLDAGAGGGDAPVATWDLLVDAAQDTGVRRLVTVAPPGAAPPAAPAYDVVLVRSALATGGPGGRSGRLSRGRRRGRPADRLAGVVAALLEADRRRDVPGVEVIDVPPGQ